jgi:hypothetical protein
MFSRSLSRWQEQFHAVHAMSFTPALTVSSLANAAGGTVLGRWAGWGGRAELTRTSGNAGVVLGVSWLKVDWFDSPTISFVFRKIHAQLTKRATPTKLRTEYTQREVRMHPA